MSDPAGDPSSTPASGPSRDRAGTPVSGRRAVCPGSYDPVTNGHVDVIARAVTLFDEVVVAVLYNPLKQGSFPVEERARLLTVGPAGGAAACASRRSPTACSSTSAASSGRPRVVKGLRGGTDFAYELPMALMNRHLSGVETVFLPGDPRFGHVSSSLVKEVAAHGGDVRGLVPEAVFEALHARV